MTEPESSRTGRKRAAAMTEPESSRTRQKRAAAMTEPESSPTRPKQAYDVFLSFRGEDTRKNFTDHLYTALVQAGIHTFRDDNELPRGEKISKHLLKAIHESKISIVVFSKGYASSRWCLDELVEILECKNRNTDQNVLPIFYDIDTSDVRKQTGSFVKAFDKHKELFKEKVQEWRKALEEAGNLSGWNLNDMADGHESKFIQKIIADVLKKLDPKCLYVATHLVGIDPIVCNISNFLTTTTDDVRMVGIHGMGGIGKTTIAKVVFNQLCYGFEGSCFLSNVKETSGQPNGLVLLQKQLLHEILKPNIWNISGVDRGMNVIKERLCHKRILVVLDDVDNLQQLNALMRERSWYGPGSRVIITTRDERLLLKVDEKYKVRQLERYESLQLFSWHAFGGKLPAEDYAELANDVVDYSGRLPLALEVLGSSLCNKNKDSWKYVIQKLRKIPNHEIQEKLKISFDTLDDDNLKNTFLDIACFFVGGRKEFVSKVLEGRSGFSPEDDLGTLIERSLIKVDHGEVINMHDLLRDMGREIVRKMSPRLGERSRIWRHEDALNALIKRMGTEAVEGLVLDVRTSNIEPLSTESFREMKYLQLLKINGVHLSGCFKVLPKGLKWLCWHGCPLKSWPSDFELSDLVILDMQYSNIKELWKETKVLNKLKILNLSYCNCLTKTPNFQSMSVEKLMLEGCSSLVDVHQSIGDLKSLVFLNLKGCCKLKNLPWSICDLKFLVTLNVSGCSQLEKLPESISVTELLADEIGSEKFLFSVGQLKNVKKLSLRGYNSIPNSPSSRSWGSLFSSWFSPRVTSLPGWGLLIELKLASFGLSEGATKCVDFGSMCSLEILDLSGNKFIDLPSGIGRLPKLQTLRVDDCCDLLSISELPSSLMELSADNCITMTRVRLPIQPKRLRLFTDGCDLMEIEGMEGLGHDHDGVTMFCRFSRGFLEKALSLLVEAMNYEIFFEFKDELPDWFSSYRKRELSELPYSLSFCGNGSISLSFHLPPFFHGLALWIVFLPGSLLESSVIIKNKSNGIQLFKYEVYCPYDWSCTISWMGYVRREDLAMEEYCGEELELEVEHGGGGSFDSVIGDIGVHVIVKKHDIDNMQETTSSADVEVWDEIDSGLYHHRLRHPLGGSITCSTKEQWKSYLTTEISKTHVVGLVSPRFASFVHT